MGPILYCGDPHGEFRHIIETAGQTKASAVVLLGDMQPERPLHIELAPLIERAVPIYLIHGNHDSDSDSYYRNVWESELAHCSVHGRVVELPNGQRLAGLGGVFRESVWYPSQSAAREGTPAFRTRQEHAKATPRQDRWAGTGHHRKHFGSIYPEEVDRLADLRADVLITHEAPGYHHNGFSLLDTLAQSMGAKVTVHGHHHDCLDSSDLWPTQGFRSYGVGLRGITAIDADGNAQVLVKGREDDNRNHRQQFLDVFKDLPP
jgi:predicted phosphodiesterase